MCNAWCTATLRDLYKICTVSEMKRSECLLGSCFRFFRVCRTVRSPHMYNNSDNGFGRPSNLPTWYPEGTSQLPVSYVGPSATKDSMARRQEIRQRARQPLSPSAPTRSRTRRSSTSSTWRTRPSSQSLTSSLNPSSIISYLVVCCFGGETRSAASVDPIMAILVRVTAPSYSHPTNPKEMHAAWSESHLPTPSI